MANELTYILGAGASYQSFPLVKTFSKRYKEFISFLNKTGIKDRMALHHAHFSAFSDNLESHQSFDTYFKKLFHTNDYHQIKKTKKILHLYFIWEHLVPPYTNNESRDTFIEESDINGFRKQSRIDKRYDALIAGILKPRLGKASVYTKTNFISWNYDLNLLSSIKNFFYPKESYESFIKCIQKNNSIWEIDEQITIINLNGYFYSKKFNSCTHLLNISAKDIIEQKIEEGFLIENMLDDDSELIRFAWEAVSESERDMQKQVIDVVKNKIANSDNIVVIGYSFPLYNRIVDYQYFNPLLLNGKAVYIQDINAQNFDDILRNDFRLDDSMEILNTPYTRMVLQANCDNFIIPSSIFKYTDSVDDL